MFGYHHSNRCMLNLWAPTLSPSYAEDVAFSVYAKHTQECEDIVAAVVEAARNGETQMTFDLDDCFSESDCEYIKRRILDELG